MGHSPIVRVEMLHCPSIFGTVGGVNLSPSMRGRVRSLLLPVRASGFGCGSKGRCGSGVASMHGYVRLVFRSVTGCNVLPGGRRKNGLIVTSVLASEHKKVGTA